MSFREQQRAHWWPLLVTFIKGISEDYVWAYGKVGLGIGIYLVHRTWTVNYQVLKGMSLKLRGDSLLYGHKTIVT